MRARGAAVVRNHPLLTPLFIVYGAINVLAVAFEAPLSHFPINLLLLAAYVVVIYVATRHRQVAAPTVQRAGTRSRDFGLAVTVAIVQLAAVIAVWFVIRPHGLPAAWASALRSAGVPHLIAAEAATALLGVGLLLVPTLVAVAAFRFRLRDVGLTANPRDLVLGVVLAAIAVGVGVAYVATGRHAGLFWESASLTVAAAAIALQSLVNGVPEELAFRGVIFGRLMLWLGRPGNSLAISTMVRLVPCADAHREWRAVRAGGRHRIVRGSTRALARLRLLPHRIDVAGRNLAHVVLGRRAAIRVSAPHIERTRPH
jgi:hypothetical protein